MDTIYASAWNRATLTFLTHVTLIIFIGTLLEKTEGKDAPARSPGTMATGDATELSPKKKRRLQEMQLLRKLSTPGTIQQISDGDGSTLNNTLKEHIEEELASYMGLTLTSEEISDFDLLGFWKRSESYTILS